MGKGRCIAVVGAGVIGLNVAWRLAEAGAAVTVVEAERPGSGTTSTSFAWVNASSKVGAREEYFRLNALALAEHRAIGAASGADGWFWPTGDVELAAGADEAAVLAAKVETLGRLGYAARMLSLAELEEIEPGTRMPPGGAAAHHGEEGWADVGRYVSALLARARSAGVTIVEGDPVAEVLGPEDRARGVRLASGATVDADAVVVAVGRWTEDFAAKLGVHVPLVGPEPKGSKAVGLLAWIRPRGLPPRRLLHATAINWSPLAGGRALLASDAGDAAVAADRSPAVAREAAEALVGIAADINPLFSGAAIEEFKVGFRALPRDAVTVCGWAEDIPSLYVVVTHSGVTLSLLLGRLVAAEVLEGREDALLAAFRPARFRAAAA